MAISYKELFDFDGLDAAFKELEQSEDHFSKAVIDDLKRIQKQSAVTKSELQKLADALKGINVTNDGGRNRLTQLAADAETAAKAYVDQNNAIAANNRMLEANRAEIQRLKNEINALKAARQQSNSAEQQARTAYQQNRAETERLRGATQQVRLEINQLTLANRQARSAVVAAAGSYREAQQRLTALGNSIKNAENGFKNTTPEIKAQIKEYNALNEALKKFDAQMGNHQRNVGNYKGALKSVTQDLLSFTSSYLSAGAALQYVFTQTLAFQNIKTPLTYIIGSEGEANNKLAELKQLANDLGVQYFVIARSYKSFTAAARASNFDLAESERIFKAITRSAAVFHLTSDQLEGSLLAIQQMISKGNVQAEELRGQLSERLPGAFALAAKAMGVTEKELNNMLKTGQVVASDMLPKLARQLEKEYGYKAAGGIKGLNSELEQLKTATQSFAGEGSFLDQNLFQPIIRGARLVINELNQMTRGSFWENIRYMFTIDNRSLENQRKVYDLRDLRKNNENAQSEAEKYSTEGKSVGDLRTKYQQLTETMRLAVKAQNDFKLGVANGTLRETNDATVAKYTAIANGIIEQRKRIGLALAQAKQQQISDTKEVADSELNSIDAIRKRISELSKMDGSAIEGSPIFNRIKALKLRLKELGDAAKDAQKHIKDAIELLEDQKKSIERSLQLDAIKGKKFGELFKPSDESLKRLYEVNRQLKIANDLQEYLKDWSRGLVLPDSAQKASESLLTPVTQTAQVTTKVNSKVAGVFTEEEAEKMKRLIKETQHEIVNLIQDSFESVTSVIGDQWAEMFRSMTDSLHSFVDNGTISFKDFANIANGIASGISGTFKAASEARISVLESEKDREVQAVGDNANAKAAIEEKYNSKIRTERRKQAKIDKEMALLSIAINTAAAIVGALAPPPIGLGPILGIPFSIAAGAVGLVQAALVLAKPIPQFYTGTENAPEGLAEVAERGRELQINPDGSKELITQRQVRHLKRGTKIKNNYDTEKWLSANRLFVDREGNLTSLSNTSELSNNMAKMDNYHYVTMQGNQQPFDYDRLIEGLGKEIEKMPFDQYFWDENGFGKFKVEQNTRIKDLNARNSWG
ncbi:tape measure protein [Pedobacter zeae]|uniref:Tape measure domain-containing protein n=1 Tax=Pedobacter zeae TaxID=1737356 RepID=A0A7W6P568_9SPHI|nr:tape measure protein [Pedobacter zeae]MBB4107752.1 tape measure domain-containing protein [Pedobacter zeae]GGG97269.1 hypothetical protein GCM10007422_09020 [Pedobacter zeae]